MFMRNRGADIDHCQQRENISLQKRNKYVQRHEQRRYEIGNQSKKGVCYLLAREHVRVETNGKRERSCEMTDDFDRQHHRCEPEHRTEKLLDISESAVGLKAGCIVVNERRDGQSTWNLQEHGGRFQSRDDADQVHKQHEKKDGSEVCQVAPATVS